MDSRLALSETQSMSINPKLRLRALLHDLANVYNRNHYHILIASVHTQSRNRAGVRGNGPYRHLIDAPHVD